MAGQSGYLIGDDIAMSLQRSVDAARNARSSAERLEQARQVVNELKKANANIAELIDANAGNYAEKNALRKALAELQPEHPLLTNTLLRDQLHAAATRVYYINQNWDDVARYGQNFRY